MVCEMLIKTNLEVSSVIYNLSFITINFVNARLVFVFNLVLEINNMLKKGGKERNLKLHLIKYETTEIHRILD